MYLYMYMYTIFVVETDSRSKKHETIVESQSEIFSTAQDSTAVSDGTGEERKDTHFAITENILIISSPQLCM